MICPCCNDYTQITWSDLQSDRVHLCVRHWADAQKTIGADLFNPQPFQEGVMKALTDPNIDLVINMKPIRRISVSEKTNAKVQTLIESIAVCNATNPAAAGLIVSDAIKALTKAINRKDVPADMERVELDQTDGPKVEFTGALIRREEYHRQSDGMIFAAELWQTKGGNWVALWESDGHISAKRIDYGDTMGAMDFWQWGSVARTLARRLKWDLRVEID